jgi:hypothetical protein
MPGANSDLDYFTEGQREVDAAPSPPSPRTTTLVTGLPARRGDRFAATYFVENQTIRRRVDNSSGCVSRGVPQRRLVQPLSRRLHLPQAGSGGRS